MLAKKTSKNQITLPKKIVGMFQGVDYFDITVKGNVITLMPVRMTPSETTLESVRDKIKALDLKEGDIKEAIRFARRKSA